MDEKKLEFRKATIKDLSKIVEMIADDALGKTRENFQIQLPEDYLTAFDRIDSDVNQELMILENEEGDILGTFQLTFIPYLTYQGSTRAQIEAVRVHKDHRGKGVGKNMFLWAIERSKERGAHLLQLTTDKQRPEAIKFYESLGFKASHEGMKFHFI